MGYLLFEIQLYLREISLHEEKTLKELSSCMVKFPQVLINVQVKTKPPMLEVPEIAAEAKRVEGALSGRGRLVLRYSGTEPKARVMIEGENKD